KKARDTARTARDQEHGRPDDQADHEEGRIPQAEGAHQAAVGRAAAGSGAHRGGGVRLRTRPFPWSGHPSWRRGRGLYLRRVLQAGGVVRPDAAGAVDAEDTLDSRVNPGHQVEERLAAGWVRGVAEGGRGQALLEATPIGRGGEAGDRAAGDVVEIDARAVAAAERSGRGRPAVGEDL